ncbi:hypothetical protein V497_02185 [Pseudogymnoascus sp. VKM F-4516 (FW-969)]|nr:hypothetical protein V497_02185 [Pseudogymnoascus sp. VKM F-4516 (FW-969)]
MVATRRRRRLEDIVARCCMEVEAWEDMEVETAVEFNLVKCRFRYLLAAGAVDAVAMRATKKERDQLQTELERYRDANARAETLVSESLIRREKQLEEQIAAFKQDEERGRRFKKSLKSNKRNCVIADDLTTELAAREERVRLDHLEAERISSLFTERERAISAREEGVQHSEAALKAQKTSIDAYQARVFHIKMKLNKSAKRLETKSLRVRASVHRGLGMIKENEARVNRESANTKRELEESLAHERNVMRAEADERNSTVANISKINGTLTVIVASLTRENASLKMPPPPPPPSMPLAPLLPSPKSRHSVVSAAEAPPRQDFMFMIGGSSRNPITADGPQDVIVLVNEMKATWRELFKPKQDYPLSWAQPSSTASCVNRRARRLSSSANGGYEGGDDPKSACRKFRGDNIPCIMAFKDAIPIVLHLPAMFRKGVVPIERGYWVGSQGDPGTKRVLEWVRAWSESDSEEEGAPASNTQMTAAVFGQLERTVGLAVASTSEGEARGE